MQLTHPSPMPRGDDAQAAARYRMLWRWHFYAGLFVMPFLVVLAVTGILYCFQPQIDRLLHRDLFVVPVSTGPRLSYDILLDKAKNAEPSRAVATTLSVESAPDHSVEYRFKLANGENESVFVNPYTGAILGRLSVEHRFTQQVRMIHRGLLLGKPGEIVMELVGCWTLVMLGTGVAMWWPSSRQPARLWPDKRRTGRAWWRDAHMALGAWVVMGALAFVLSGLPWTSTWGKWFKQVVTTARVGYPLDTYAPQSVHSLPPGAAPSAARQPDAHSDVMPGMVMDDLPVKQLPWAVGALPVPTTAAENAPSISIDRVVALAAAHHVTSGYQIVLPKRPTDVYTVTYFALDPRDERTLHIDRYDGRVLKDIGFRDYGFMGAAVSYGTGLHMGRVFGLANQLLCTAISLSIMALALSGFWLWLKRRPTGQLAAPARPASVPAMRAWIVGLAGLGILFPLLGLTLLLTWLFDNWIAGRHDRGTVPV
ncbi:PepSY-associated TM helix domain-containing protein [Robbsia andropogonis]|uniref:PepSY-associated TM helix domain-containing protein n=1 Tax=Robbsia andropogonis TaxID=28092 RepID=UPI000465FF22|nr:PepSY domain-containing protein [Robbsia andropogonis]